MQRIEESWLNLVVCTFLREEIQFLLELFAVSGLNDGSALVLKSLFDVDTGNGEDIRFALSLFFLDWSINVCLFAADVLENIVHLQWRWALYNVFILLFCASLRKLR